MNNFYPLFEEFIKRLEEAAAPVPPPKFTNSLPSIIPKLIEQDEVTSPYTGKKIDMKKLRAEMEEAKFKIVSQSPLYGPYVHDFDPVIYTWLVPTMATDGVRLFVNPEFASNLTWLGKIFVLIHEIMHCILVHAQRSEGLDPETFNMAADLEVNPIIVDTTDDFDEKFIKEEIAGLYDKKYLRTPVEDIYRDILKNKPDIKQKPQDIKIDPTKLKPPQPSQTPPPLPSAPKRITVEITPGTKVRIKATGQKGIVKKVNSDGTFEVDPINESLFMMHKLLLESYKREDLVPILPGGESGSSSGGGQTTYTHEVEFENQTGKKQEDKKKGQGQGQGESEKEKQGQKQPGQGKGQGKGESEDEGEGQGKGESEGEDEGQSKDQRGQKAKEKEMEGKAGEMTKGSAKHMSPEDALAVQQKVASKMQNADPGKGGGVISTKDGEEIARASGYDDDEINAGEEGRQKWRENAREMMETLEKSKQAGSGRGDALIDRLKKILKPSVDWKTLLKIFVGSALSPEKQWRVGAKKHLYKSDEYLKRGLKVKRDAINKVIVCVDFSGSMFGGQITAFDRCISEIQNIIYAKKIREIIVIYFDDGVDPGSIQTVKRGEKIFRPKLGKGGGGTNFQSPLDWIKDKYNDHVNLCIFLTDGYAPMPKKPPYDRKFIWVVYDNPDFEVPFGRGIITTSDDLSS